MFNVSSYQNSSYQFSDPLKSCTLHRDEAITDFLTIVRRIFTPTRIFYLTCCNCIWKKRQSPLSALLPDRCFSSLRISIYQTNCILLDISTPSIMHIVPHVMHPNGRRYGHLDEDQNMFSRKARKCRFDVIVDIYLKFPPPMFDVHELEAPVSAFRTRNCCIIRLRGAARTGKSEKRTCG